MKTLYSIINFPITLILGLITVILCFPLIWEKVSKYNKDEIDYTGMLIEVSIIINNFPLVSGWISIPSGFRAFTTVIISFYLFY